MISRITNVAAMAKYCSDPLQEASFPDSRSCICSPSAPTSCSSRGRASCRPFQGQAHAGCGDQEGAVTNPFQHTLGYSNE